MGSALHLPRAAPGRSQSGWQRPTARDRASSPPIDGNGKGHPTGRRTGVRSRLMLTTPTAMSTSGLSLLRVASRFGSRKSRKIRPPRRGRVTAGGITTPDIGKANVTSGGVPAAGGTSERVTRSRQRICRVRGRQRHEPPLSAEERGLGVAGSADQGRWRTSAVRWLRQERCLCDRRTRGRVCGMRPGVESLTSLDRHDQRPEPAARNARALPARCVPCQPRCVAGRQDRIFSRGLVHRGGDLMLIENFR